MQHEGTVLTSPVPEAPTSAATDWPSSDAVEASGEPAAGAECSGGTDPGVTFPGVTFPGTTFPGTTPNVSAIHVSMPRIPDRAAAQGVRQRNITARGVALDRPYFYNRPGAANPAGMIHARRRDVVETIPGGGLSAGKVTPRHDKRPRPLVLRRNAGDGLRIIFQNLLAKGEVTEDQPA